MTGRVNAHWRLETESKGTQTIRLIYRQRAARSTHPATHPPTNQTSTSPPLLLLHPPTSRSLVGSLSFSPHSDTETSCERYEVGLFYARGDSPAEIGYEEGSVCVDVQPEGLSLSVCLSLPPLNSTNERFRSWIFFFWLLSDTASKNHILCVF